VLHCQFDKIAVPVLHLDGSGLEKLTPEIRGIGIIVSYKLQAFFSKYWQKRAAELN